MTEAEFTPFQHEPDTVLVRFIVRRVNPMPGSRVALLAGYGCHTFITQGTGNAPDLEADNRRHTKIENVIRDPASSTEPALKYGVYPVHKPETLATLRSTAQPDGKLSADMAGAYIWSIHHPPDVGTRAGPR